MQVVSVRVAAQQLRRYRQRRVSLQHKIIAGSFPSTEYKSLNTDIIVRDLWHSPLTIPLFYIII